MMKRWLALAAATSLMLAAFAGWGAGCGSGTMTLAGLDDAGPSTTTTSSGQGGNGQGGDIGIGGLNGQGGTESPPCDIDFLFVIDNSVSMRNEQEALIASFPSFIETIEATVDTSSDYHIMVTDTDDWGRCTAENCQTGEMNAQELCINAAGGYACNTDFDDCDKTIGAGVVHPAGKGASNQPCTIYGGNRYIIAGEPDPVGTFSCMALVGLAGHPSERPMDSLVAAMSDELNGPGGCNEGFLRDNAILVVTFISDDPWYEDSGTPQDWYDAVLAAKNGDPAAVAVLGLTPNFDGCRDGAGPPKGAHWGEFVAMWGDHGLEASVCNDDYGPFFEEAVVVVDLTCDEFQPPQ